MPVGLSSSRTPSMRRRSLTERASALRASGLRASGGPARSLRLRPELAIGRHRLVDELRHPHARLDRIVVRERELRHRIEVQAPRQLAAQKTGGARQSLRRLVARFLAREMREAHGRMRQVGRNVDAGDRHRADARVLHLVTQEIGKLALDLIADAVGALGMTFHVLIPAPLTRASRSLSPRGRGLDYNVRDTSTISYTSS